MKFEDLKLAYGYPLQLQTAAVAGPPERYSCRLIGCLPGRSLLLSVPKLTGKLVRFSAGQKIVVRLMIENGIGIFAGIVEAQTTEPYPILHLSFPESVTFKGIRSATRVAVNERVDVISAVAGNVQTASGFISDISINGCRLDLEADVACLGDALALTAEVDICGLKRLLILKGVVRSKGEPAGNINEPVLMSYGIEFSGQSDEELLVMYAYVFRHLALQD